jgi:calcium-dependent protein kinase
MNEAKLKNFKNFAKTSKLQQAALTAISVQTSPEDIKDLKNLFMSLDKNGDGCLTIDELKIGLNKRENGATLL